MKRLISTAAARGDALEALIGLALITAGVAMLSVPAALIVCGAVIFLSALLLPVRRRG
jgi:hypothetical protein